MYNNDGGWHIQTCGTRRLKTGKLRALLLFNA
nr:MAG TPA: hypothetical protein [Caudoviricetes sp.]